MQLQKRLRYLTDEKLFHIHSRYISIDINIKKEEDAIFDIKVRLKRKNLKTSLGKRRENYIMRLNRSYYSIKKQLSRVTISRMCRDLPAILLD